MEEEAAAEEAAAEEAVAEEEATETEYYIPPVKMEELEERIQENVAQREIFGISWPKLFFTFNF